MWMVKDALEVRIAQGKSHTGALPERVTLTLDGKRVYQLQKFLEEEMTKGGDHFRIRWLVLMAEDLRLAVTDFRDAQQTRKMV